MSKFQISLNGNKTPAELELKPNNVAEYKGKEYPYECKLITDDFVVLRINGKNFLVRKESEENNLFTLLVNSEKCEVICKNELDMLKEKFGVNDNSRFKNEVISPMPGAVVKLNVSEGESVNKGQVLLVLEAMKMENEIKAERDCIVSKIHTEEKKSVDKGQKLISLSQA